MTTTATKKDLPTIYGGEFATILRAGTYRAETPCILTRFHGKGDGRREVETQSIKAGEEFSIPYCVNGFWFGFESISWPSADDVVLQPLSYRGGDNRGSSSSCGG